MLSRHGKRLLKFIDFEFSPADLLLKVLADLLMRVDFKRCILLVLRKKLYKFQITSVKIMINSSDLNEVEYNNTAIINNVQ